MARKKEETPELYLVGGWNFRVDRVTMIKKILFAIGEYNSSRKPLHLSHVISGGSTGGVQVYAMKNHPNASVDVDVLFKISEDLDALV